MTLRAKLFATVALPLLSASFAFSPAHAAGQEALLLAQAADDAGGADVQAPDAPAVTEDASGADAQSGGEEEVIKKKRKKKAEQQQQEQAPAAEEQAPAAQEQAPAAEEQAPAAAEQAPAEEPAQPKKKHRKKDAAAEQQQEQAPAAEEQAPAAQEQAPAAEEQAPAAAEQAPAEEPAQPKKKHRKKDAAAEQQQEQAPAAEEQTPSDAQQPSAEPSATQEQAPAASEQAPAEEPAQPKKKQRKKDAATEQGQTPAATGEAPAATEQAPAATGEAPAATGEAPATTEQAPAAGETAPATGETAPATGEQTAPATGEPAAPAAGEQQTAPATNDQSAVPADGNAPAAALPSETLTQEQKQEIAKDPSKTTDTVVLPVENGAAVLDSDKDAATSPNAAATVQKRSKLRAQEEAAPPPKTDAAAQADMTPIEPAKFDAAIKEEGQKMSEAPTFDVPGATNVTNNVTNNTVNNTVNNTTVVNNVNQVKVVNQVDDRTVIDVGGRIVVRSDDRPRLRMDSSESYYEQLSRGRTREVIERENGARIVTIYNRYGEVIQRSRFSPDGEEYVMVYAPEAATDGPRHIYDAGYDLPPMRLTVPVDDYIVSTSREPDEDYYDFLEKPPVERVERVYTLDEVKYSARIRDKVRRIDLDTITFATGSAEVPMSQAKTLRKVADAIVKVLKKDPGETFLIEGHTDAVGSDQSNLVLSDQRASSVAELLTQVYNIPPENLATQGYGERYLKIKTEDAEQQNRRVTIRRVTPLIRPMAQAK